MVGSDAVKLLNDSLKKRDEVKIDVVAILNDTTGTLVKGAYDNPNTVIGLILGTGCNGAYLEKIQNIVRRVIDVIYSRKAPPVTVTGPKWLLGSPQGLNTPRRGCTAP